MKKITNFTQIKEIIEPIPANKFISTYYGTSNGNSCFLGHIHRKLNKDKNLLFGLIKTNNPNSYMGDGDGYGARQLTAKFLKEKHGISDKDGADVNNEPKVNGYTERLIKDRLMHMINDAIAAGY